MSTQPIFFFGDSLTDNGNLYAYGEGLLPDEVRDSLAGPTGAVSDGPTHAAYTAEILGAAEVNYAVAAAEALGSYTLEELVVDNGLEGELLVPLDDPALDLDINLPGQLDRFAADQAGEDLSQSAAYLLIGGNDFQNLDFDAPTLIQDALALIEDIIAAQLDAALNLFAQGMGTVWLAELPVAEFFAESEGFSDFELAAAQFAFGSFNTGLADAVSQLQDMGLNAQLGETSIVTEAIAEDPTGFGLLAPYGDTLLYSDAADSFDPDQIAFYDDIHPTTATHGILGVANALQLSGGHLVADRDGIDHTILDGADFAVFGLGGDDTVEALSANDIVVFGGTGNDSLIGSTGSDLLSGGAGDDAVDGRRGDDVLTGGIGNDVVRGMIGADVLIDGLGDDFLRGGVDDDIFIFTEASLLGGTENGLNVIVGGQGYDTLYLVLAEAADVTQGLLDGLGLRTALIEEIVVLEGRDALDGFADQAWYDDADLWGLV